MSLTSEADKVLTAADYAISMSSLMLKDIQKALYLIPVDKINNIIDLGCGYGGVTRLIADYFSASKVTGVDYDARKLEIAESRHIHTLLADLETPQSFGKYDLVTSFGVIEHMKYYDGLLKTAHNLLHSGGYLVISWPNLGSFTQRIALLLGYQPNEVEISNEIYAGTIYASGGDNSKGQHIHSATIRAMCELLAHHGFGVQAVMRGNPRITGKYSAWNLIITAIGRVCPIGMCRRPIIIARKK